MRPNDRPTKRELVRLRAMALWVQRGRPLGQESEIWAQAAREIEYEAKTLGGEQRPAENRPARLA